jgi:AcrR family transcriptional regulator
MATVRLDSDERRRAIVEAAMPLFARKGFSGTTTREIAEAARISEALLFKHFPTKGALYQDMLRSGCSADPGLLERLKQTEPSTQTLIMMMHFMVYQFVIGGFGNPAEREPRQRLMLNSFLEDGEFARLTFDWVATEVYPKFGASIAAAERAGDLVPLAIAPINRFWFAQHVAATLAFVRLPGRAIVPYDTDLLATIGQAVRFILRGIGLKDEVIAAQYDPTALSIFHPPLTAAD